MPSRLKAAYRLDKARRPYRKMSDRIKPTSKGAFLQAGTITDCVYDGEGNLIKMVVQDLSESKVVGKKRGRKPRRKPAKRRTVLRKAVRF